MNDLSNEQIEVLIPEFDKFDDKRMADALRELLAHREAQGKPVGYLFVSRNTGGVLYSMSDHPVEGFTDASPIYTAPQLPAALTVWYGEMPETNGKSNWTAILHRKGGCLSTGMTIERSEYPDRVRYEADRMRHLIGELEQEPEILDYDAGKHSGYIRAAPQLPAVPDEMTPEMMRAVQLHSELGVYAANNLSGAYDLFREFWSVACRAAMLAAAPKPDSDNVTDNTARQFESLSSGSKNG